MGVSSVEPDAMAQTYPDQIWHNGRIKPWAEATVHVMAHALHYGSSVFEGIRSYETPNGPAIFRLSDHTKRLFNSAKIYDIRIPYTLEEINAACRAVRAIATPGSVVATKEVFHTNVLWIHASATFRCFHQPLSVSRDEQDRTL